MSQQNSQKQAVYDNAAYVARGVVTSIMTAGSGGVSGKFVAHANMLLFSLNAYTTIAGTSTYTNTQYYNNPQTGTNTSQTVHANTTQLSLIRITNTATLGVAPALSTSTIGPFSIDTPYANGTGTGGVGVVAQFALNTSTGTAGLNGLAINQGDQFFVVNGTDATAVNLITIDYQVTPNSNLIA